MKYLVALQKEWSKIMEILNNKLLVLNKKQNTNQIRAWLCKQNKIWAVKIVFKTVVKIMDCFKFQIMW
jgi:hypothetical protein